MLKCGAAPDVENWDHHDGFKIVGTYGINFLFCIELSGLPILNDSNTGRGQREKKKKKLSLPGETTTDIKSDEEEKPLMALKKRPFKGRTSLPLPPTGLLVAKQSTNLSSKATQETSCGLIEQIVRRMREVDAHHTRVKGSTVAPGQVVHSPLVPADRRIASTSDIYTYD
ncbi:hypothetical protein GHT06_017162 [Daphnia sinensis]|uniref:Uncharacterized protein n=1 Tax=Daphnia sinensis TaxID=1820382 RepID=A0AAD5KQG0_9CRUS|nr:hypothetical protein GHT06_017162 [Daphnia sinensis]